MHRLYQSVTPSKEMVGMMMAEKLKLKTAHFHKLSEELNFSSRLTEGCITREEYIVLLKRLLHFFRQVKTISDKYPQDTVVSNNLFYEKVNCLENDLAMLGSNTADEYHVFDNFDYYTYLGFCYVPLGSLFGGQMIYKSLLKMQRENGHVFPCSFYESCKQSLLMEWKEYTSQLQEGDEEHYNEILNGANSSYLYFIYLCTIIR